MNRRQWLFGLVGAALTAACDSPPPAQPTLVIFPTPVVPLPSPAAPLAPQAAPPVVVPVRSPPPSPSPSPSPFASPSPVPLVLKRPGLLAVERDGRILTVNPANADSVRTLVDGPDNAEPRWAPDGQSLLFRRGLGPTAELERIMASGGPARRLTANRRPERGAVWSPGGDRVAFTLPRTDDPRAFDDLREPEEVWLLDLATGADRKLADGFDPAWSPRGDAIVYATNGQRDDQGPRANALRIVGVDGQGDRPLLAVADLPADFLPPFGLPFKPATIRLRAPAWSPDGRLIVASADGHTSMALTVDERGQSLRPWALTFDGGIGRTCWSPDASRLAVEVMPATGVAVVLVVELASGRETRLGGPELGIQAAEPTWSPDGRGLALITSDLPGREARAQTTVLRLYAPDGAELARLLAVSDLARPDWGTAP